MARAEVILCAGAINSPQILMLSGIGPAAHLRAHGIEVKRNLPGVGTNLQEHIGVSIQASVNVPTLNSDMRSARAAWHALNWLLFKRGALCAAFEAVAFVRVLDGAAEPDVQLHFGAIGARLTPNGFVPYDEPTVTIHVNPTRPRSRGEIRLTTADPLQPPLILPNMMSDEQDLRTLIEGGRFARRILAASAFTGFVLREVAPGAEVHSDEEWEAFIRTTAAPEYHPAGTCRMGRDPLAVTDPELRVHGVAGLRIADASVIPALPSANTNAACVMIGEKAADLIAHS